MIEVHMVNGRPLRLLPRESWRPKAATSHPMRLPALGITLHHSVTIADDDHDLLATDDVAADMREIEAVGIARFGRFSYCYAVHPSGIVGVGAGLTVGAHTADHNSTRIGVVFVGDMTKTPPTSAAIEAATLLIAWHRQSGRLVPGYNVNGHRAYKATACPGIPDATMQAIDRAARLDRPNPTEEPDVPTIDTDRLLDAIEQSRPFAVRVKQALDGRPAGQVWIIGHGGRYPVGRATLNALYYVRAIRLDDGGNPPEVDAKTFADVPPVR